MVPVRFNISFKALTEEESNDWEDPIIDRVTCEGSGEVCDEKEVCLIVVVSQSYLFLLLNGLLWDFISLKCAAATWADLLSVSLHTVHCKALNG